MLVLVLVLVLLLVLVTDAWIEFRMIYKGTGRREDNDDDNRRKRGSKARINVCGQLFGCYSFFEKRRVEVPKRRN